MPVDPISQMFAEVPTCPLNFNAMTSELVGAGYLKQKKSSQDAALVLIPFTPHALDVVRENPKLAIHFDLQGSSCIGLKLGADTCKFATLATIGRKSGNTVKLSSKDSSLPGHLCSIIIDQKNNKLHMRNTSPQGAMLRGTSSTRQFDRTTPKHVMLEGLTDWLYFGQSGNEWNDYRFFISWPQPTFDLSSVMKPDDRGHSADAITTSPSNVSISRYYTRIPGDTGPAKDDTYCDERKLGRGSFGTIWRSTNLKSGTTIAIKQTDCQRGLARPSPTSLGKFEAAKREIMILRKLKHTNVIEYKGSWVVDGKVRLGLALQTNSVEGLIELHQHRIKAEVSYDMTFQMLKALAYLEEEKIIHFDVKPHNILFTEGHHTVTGRRFVLSDFGLARETRDLTSATAGTILYRAPELCEDRDSYQDLTNNTPRQRPPITGKIDVWSLYVSMLAMLNFKGFQQKRTRLLESGHTSSEPGLRNQHSNILRTIAGMKMPFFEKMCAESPEKRATAAEVLYKMSQLDRGTVENFALKGYLQLADELEKSARTTQILPDIAAENMLHPIAALQRKQIPKATKSGPKRIPASPRERGRASNTPDPVQAKVSAPSSVPARLPALSPERRHISGTPSPVPARASAASKGSITLPSFANFLAGLGPAVSSARPAEKTHNKTPPRDTTPPRPTTTSKRPLDPSTSISRPASKSPRIQQDSHFTPYSSPPRRQ